MVKYSVSEENHIKAIFHLQKEAENVSTQELAEKLNTKPASYHRHAKETEAQKTIGIQTLPWIQAQCRWKQGGPWDCEKA